LFFHNFFGSRTLVTLTRREAGENPALPRNCKRGNRSRSLGEAREGRLYSSDVEKVGLRSAGQGEDPCPDVNC
jgi:hypothetical protein